MQTPCQPRQLANLFRPLLRDRFRNKRKLVVHIPPPFQLLLARVLTSNPRLLVLWRADMKRPLEVCHSPNREGSARTGLQSIRQALLRHGREPRV